MSIGTPQQFFYQYAAVAELSFAHMKGEQGEHTLCGDHDQVHMGAARPQEPQQAPFLRRLHSTALSACLCNWPQGSCLLRCHTGDDRIRLSLSMLVQLAAGVLSIEVSDRRRP